MDWLDTLTSWFTDPSGRMDMSAAMGAGSAVVAFFSALFSWQTMRKQEKRAVVSLKLAHDNDIIRWSDEAIATLAEAHEMLCEKGVAYPDNDYRGRRSAARARLSAIIDRGRLFFPNRTDTDHGADKGAAYKGHRQAALDALVDAYDLLGAAGQQTGPDMDASEKLNAIRKRFVTEVFKAVDPVRRGTTLKELST